MAESAHGSDNLKKSIARNLQDMGSAPTRSSTEKKIADATGSAQDMELEVFRDSTNDPTKMDADVLVSQYAAAAAAAQEQKEHEEEMSRTEEEKRLDEWHYVGEKERTARIAHTMNHLVWCAVSRKDTKPLFDDDLDRPSYHIIKNNNSDINKTNVDQFVEKLTIFNPPAQSYYKDDDIGFLKEMENLKNKKTVLVFQDKESHQQLIKGSEQKIASQLMEVIPCNEPYGITDREWVESHDIEKMCHGITDTLEIVDGRRAELKHNERTPFKNTLRGAAQSLGQKLSPRMRKNSKRATMMEQLRTEGEEAYKKRTQASPLHVDDSQSEETTSSAVKKTTTVHNPARKKTEFSGTSQAAQDDTHAPHNDASRHTQRSVGKKS